MEAFKLTARASEGKLSIAVPEEFNGKDLEVIVLMQPMENEVQKDEVMAELHRRRMEHFGKAKYPDFPITKYDAYNQ